MKSDKIFDAIGKAEDRYIVSAWNRINKMREASGTDGIDETERMNSKYGTDRNKRKNVMDKKSRTDEMNGMRKTIKQSKMIRNSAFHKFMYSAAAIIVLLVSFFSVAMAVNADFRAALFRFFHIPTADVVLPKEEEPEQPGSLGDINYIDSKNIGDKAEVDYVQVNGNMAWSDGVIWVASYEEETNGEIMGAYALENGQLTSLEPHAEKLEYIWDGETYEISFDWYEHNGKVHVFAHEFDRESYKEWFVQAGNGESDYVIIELGRGAQSEYTSRPLIYDLKTKKVTDVLEGCEISESQLISDIEFSPDLSKVLIGGNQGMGSPYCQYYYDVTGKVLKPLDELTGAEVSGAFFLDDNTINCILEDEDGSLTCRSYTVPSWEFIEIYAGLPGKRWDTDFGVMFTGGRYVLFVDMEHNTYVYDCKTGERALVEGFKYPSGNAGVTLNKAGDKILFDLTDSSAPGLGVSQIGVLDLEKRSFTLLDREGYEVRFEGSMSWFDNDRVAIQAYEDNEPSVGIQYLYIYTIK